MCLFGRLHHDDGRRGVDEDLQAFEAVCHLLCHMCLTSRDLLSYNKEFGPTRISLWIHKGNEPHMPNHLSPLKHARQTETRTARNRANTSRLRVAFRQFRRRIAKRDHHTAHPTYTPTPSSLDNP